jgi:predicted Zn-dependent protease
MKKTAWLLTIVAALLLTGCAPTTKGGAIGANRSQFMLISSEQAFSSGNSFYLQEVKNADKNSSLNPDKKQTERLKAIAARLVPQTRVFRDDAPSWNWEVNVMKSPEINAYCAGRGKIMFYTGILEKVTITDDEIAAVMGHEIAHALREHARERMSQSYAQNLGLTIAGALTKSDGLTMQAAVVLSQLAITLPYSREHEREADRMGLELMARAGYDPNAAIKVWEKMAKMGGSKTPEFLSTHPSNQSRINDMRSYLGVANELYREVKGIR